MEGLGEESAKTVRIEMARAYDLPSLQKLTRTIRLGDGGGEVALSDDFVFTEAPGELEEAFLTYLPAEVSDGGSAVRIESETGAAELVADGAEGVFRVSELTDESARECRHGGLLRRITFHPAERSERMTLRFVLQWGGAGPSP